MSTRELSNNRGYIKRSFKRTAKKYPALVDMLAKFEILALKRAEIRKKLQNMPDIPEFSMEANAFARGIPVFNNFEINNIDKEFSMVTEELEPALLKAFKPLSQDIKIINQKIKKKELNIQECIDSLLDDEPGKLENLGASIHIPPEILNFILSQSLKIIFETTSAELEKSLDKTGWVKGYCPFCGSFPDISFLRTEKTDQEKSEFLKAHGGQFWLHCSQCSHEWRIKRSLCAYCDNEDKKYLGYFSVKKNNKERVYTCNACKKYIPCIDEREDIEPDHPESMLVGAVPLYIVAQEKGFTPMVNTPLNNFRL